MTFDRDAFDRQMMALAIEQGRLSVPVSTGYCVGAVLVLAPPSPLPPQPSVPANPASPPASPPPLSAALAATPSLVATGFSREIPGNTHAEECCILKFAECPSAAAAVAAGVASPACITASELGAATGGAPPRFWMYTTMEPCAQRLSGNKPCAERLVEMKVERVIVASKEPGYFIGSPVGDKVLESNGIKSEYITGFEGKALILHNVLGFPAKVLSSTLTIK
ncbi:hypothetical protein DFJ73DRAFT_21268 [Zopfochytrium polystomum]|nr:hypothetical protein DFJ73DRAFT_21268 [Zopfochytrium polystomum]